MKDSEADAELKALEDAAMLGVIGRGVFAASVFKLGARYADERAGRVARSVETASMIRTRMNHDVQTLLEGGARRTEAHAVVILSALADLLSRGVVMLLCVLPLLAALACGGQVAGPGTGDVQAADTATPACEHYREFQATMLAESCALPYGEIDTSDVATCNATAAELDRCYDDGPSCYLPTLEGPALKTCKGLVPQWRPRSQ